MDYRSYALYYESQSVSNMTHIRAVVAEEGRWETPGFRAGEIDAVLAAFGDFGDFVDLAGRQTL
jgi:hypothetical protein